MYLHLLEVFIPAQRGYRHPALKPKVARLTNLTTENSMVFEFRHDPDDLYEKLPIERYNTLFVYNRRVVSDDMPYPDYDFEGKTLWQRAMDMNYSHVQLRTLQALGFTQKENGDYYTEKYKGPQGKTQLLGEVRVMASAKGELTYYNRMYSDSPWRCLGNLSPIDFDNIPDFILQGE